jgi:hypothetical protein
LFDSTNGGLNVKCIKHFIEGSGYAKDMLQRTFYVILEQLPKITIIKRQNKGVKTKRTKETKYKKC